MARFWLTGAVAALTGPQFLWGTLLINVGGSFVIGLFGALTGSRGAVSVPPDIRIFVMVGICGGFTTFSSFSLQTLELLQSGEILWPNATSRAPSRRACAGSGSARCRATADAPRQHQTQPPPPPHASMNRGQCGIRWEARAHWDETASHGARPAPGTGHREEQTRR